MKHARVCAIVLAVVARGCATGSDAAPIEGESDAGAVADAPVDHADSYDGARSDDAPSAEASGDDSSGDDSSGDDSSGDDSGATSDDSASPDAADASDHDANEVGTGPTNLAPLGKGYTWQSMTSASANSGKLAAPAVNDDSLSTQVNIDSSSGDIANAWEAAGVIFASPRTVTSVSFVQGTTVSGGDGWFEANFELQLSTDGSSWSTAAWGASPAYSYTTAVSGKTYTFSGAAAPGIFGVRVIGQVNTLGNSWWAAAKELIVLGH